MPLITHGSLVRDIRATSQSVFDRVLNSWFHIKSYPKNMHMYKKGKNGNKKYIICIFAKQTVILLVLSFFYIQK